MLIIINHGVIDLFIFLFYTIKFGQGCPYNFWALGVWIPPPFPIFVVSLHTSVSSHSLATYKHRYAYRPWYVITLCSMLGILSLKNWKCIAFFC